MTSNKLSAVRHPDLHRRGGGHAHSPIIVLVLILAVSASLLAFYDFNGNSLDPTDREIRLVVSGSMDAGPTDNGIPTIPKDSLVMIRHLDSDDIDSIVAGDIVAYSLGQSVVIHRVVSVDHESGILTLKGDANASSETVSSERIVGEVVGVSHVLGEAAVLARSSPALILAGAACLAVMIFSLREIFCILRERNGDE